VFRFSRGKREVSLLSPFCKAFRCNPLTLPLDVKLNNIIKKLEELERFFCHHCTVCVAMPPPPLSFLDCMSLFPIKRIVPFTMHVVHRCTAIKPSYYAGISVLRLNQRSLRGYFSPQKSFYNMKGFYLPTNDGRKIYFFGF
jgi:hypothetical protein